MKRVPIEKHPNFRIRMDDFGGKSLADMWDESAGRFKSDAPLCIQGITDFLAADDFEPEDKEVMSPL